MFKNFFSYRTLLIALFYTLLIVVSMCAAFLIRADYDIDIIKNWSPINTLVLAIIIKLSLLFFAGQFKGLLTFFYMPDFIRVVVAASFSSILITAITKAHLFTPFGDAQLQRGVLLLDYILFLGLICIFRILLRMYRESILKDNFKSVKKRVAIIGAGDTGCSLASSLMSNRNFGIMPVAFFDDDKKKQFAQIMGLNVYPINADLPHAIKDFQINSVIIAMPRSAAQRIDEITQALNKAQIPVSILPPTDDMALGRINLSRIRNVEIEDILGREAITLESASIEELIKGKVILVTGAGGSIGSELCRQIAEKNPFTLIMVEQSEVQMFQIEQELLENGYGIDMRSVIADVVDESKMDSIFENFKPDIVFHAAAHKHVPLMEAQPSEAIKNNTYGTWITAKLASKHKAEKFVLISTDKAINPANVMGASKRLAEMAVRSLQNSKDNSTIFAAVRFGNVLGSSGSVIPTFKKQIEKGGPVTVTHPDITRYFMTIPEAVGLVLQCASLADKGEIFVLDMGAPMKIIDIARKLIKLSGFEPDIDIPIEIVGLRPGEKLFEEIQHKNEHLIPTKHPRIFGFYADNPSEEEMIHIIGELLNGINKAEANDVKRMIAKHVPEYKMQIYN